MCATCDALRHEIALLKEEVEAWVAYARDERRGGADEDRLAVWRRATGMRGMAPTLALMLLADRPGRVVTRLAIIEATRAACHTQDADRVELNVASAFVCHIRIGLRALAASGRLPTVFSGKVAGIESLWGQGWSMTVENAAAVRALAGEA